MKKNLVILLAGGSGSRIDKETPKQFLNLAGKPILEHTLRRFQEHENIHDVILVTNPEYLEKTREVVRESGCTKVSKILAGGAARQDSSRNGVMAVEEGAYENVLIHDAARPFVSHDIIDRILAALETHEAVNVGIPSADTLVEMDEKGFIKAVPDRARFRRVQTPQAFKLKLIRRAHTLALERGLSSATDDCGLILRMDLAPVFVVEGSITNIKITYPSDLPIAEKILREQAS